MSITGEPGRGPMRVGIPIADLSAGLFCALGILVALLEREQSGKGQEVATSLLQAQIFMLDFQGSRWLNAARGARARPATIIRPASRPACSRRATATSTSPPPAATMWKRLCRAIGAQALLRQSASMPPAAARLQEPRRAERRDRQLSRRRHQRRVGRAHQCGRRAVRHDLHHRQGVRRPAGEALCDRAGRRDGGRARHPAPGRPARDRSRARRAASSHRRRSAASTPRRCCASSASPTPRSPACASQGDLTPGRYPPRSPGKWVGMSCCRAPYCSTWMTRSFRRTTGRMRPWPSVARNSPPTCSHCRPSRWRKPPAHFARHFWADADRHRRRASCS